MENNPMHFRTGSSLFGLVAASALFNLTFVDASLAQSLQRQCSEKYQAAKAAGSLNGQAWPQFYSACVTELKAAAPEAAPVAAPAAAPVAVPEPAPVAAPPVPAAAEAPPPPPPAPVPAPVAETPAPAPANPLKTPPMKGKPEKMAPAAPAAASEAVFPTAIDPAFAKLKPGLARQKTCAAQYAKNKATNANAGLKWIQKGGGYYSECNNKLKM
jgi:hypothetical protein